MKLTRTLLMLLVCSTVILAGCTGMGGLTGDSGGGADDGAAAGGNGGAGGSGNGGNGGNDGASNAGGANDSASGNSTNEAGATDRSAAGSGGGNESNSDDSGASGSNGSSGAESDGANESVESDGAAKTDIEPLDADWYNATKNGYVFEITDAKNGSGTATFEPPADPGPFSVPTLTFEGEKTFEQAYTSQAEEMGDPTGLVLYPLAAAGTLALGIDTEDLAVGYENSTTSDGSTVTTTITGTDSYGGVGCYATEVSIDGDKRLETCIVPYKEGVMASGYLPYAAFYDDEGKLGVEVKLEEIKEG